MLGAVAGVLALSVAASMRYPGRKLEEKKE
jgi:hypothetical protein